MNYAKAFKSLGYDLQSPRNDWSSENEKGVCVSIRRIQIQMRNRLPYIDTAVNSIPLASWSVKPGNTKRKRHLTRAIQELAGAVDVIIVDGTPGSAFVDAEPWDPLQRGASWHITNFDPETGHFCAEVRRLNNSQ